MDTPATLPGAGGVRPSPPRLRLLYLVSVITESYATQAAFGRELAITLRHATLFYHIAHSLTRVRLFVLKVLIRAHIEIQVTGKLIFNHQIV